MDGFWFVRYFLGLMGIFMTIDLSIQKRDFYFSVNTFEIKSHQNELAQVNSSLGRTKTGLPVSSYGTLLMNFDTYGISVNVSLKQPGGDYILLVSKKISNICPYMEMENRPMDLAFLLFNEFKSQGHIPKCPVKKGTYFIKNFELSPELFPPYVPEGSFCIEGTFHFRHKTKLYDPLLHYKVVGNVNTQRNIFQLKPILVKGVI
ncbi:unnamed protein product [Hermetia illucens]|uniref:MD-2-related lipid-recognition domain-containing protein n=1 Tax=Hermetia illucens TaxID=343691 RepID=A0A7R8YPW5_HERIL|nr:unnamed protein product [Hermetia illucens]